jgi:TetR/AcrR family transcriptional repressor of nem operon
VATGQNGNSGTASRILDVAERLVQIRGFNGFSYADVAAELKISKAALHYHFAGKAELGEALLARYAARFAQALAAVDTDLTEAPAKLDGYAGLYLEVLRHRRMCLCGMLAAEYATLPRPMQEQLKLFFDFNERWLTAVLEAGSRAGRFGFKEAPRERAQVLLGALEGAMLVARSYGDPQRFRLSAQHVLADLGKVEQLPTRKTKAASKG